MSETVPAFGWEALFIAAFLAGWIDAAAGGGGMIQVPALLLSFPSAPVPLLFGTNKLASSIGTSVAILTYRKSVPYPWRFLAPIMFLSALGAAVGASLTHLFHRSLLQWAAIGLLSVVLLYTILWAPDPRRPRVRQGVSGMSKLGAFALIPLIGAYDGFFGPGTGSFLIATGVLLLNLDFLTASAHAKAVNLATNIGALSVFAAAGSLDLYVGGLLAEANLTGNRVGASTAIKIGARGVRWLLIGVTSALLARLIFQSAQ